MTLTQAALSDISCGSPFKSVFTEPYNMGDKISDNDLNRLGLLVSPVLCTSLAAEMYARYESQDLTYKQRNPRLHFSPLLTLGISLHYQQKIYQTHHQRQRCRIKSSSLST
jgi:hypothetical protein